MDLTQILSCDGFPTDTTSSSGGKFPHKERKKKELLEAEQTPCSENVLTSTTSSSSFISSAVFKSDCQLHKYCEKQPPNIGYELAVAKSALQQYSTLSGDNLFDHLSDIIKRVIDERPPNVIDFFEEFSRSVREQKFHLPERFPPDAIYDESRMYRIAKRQLLSMKLPYNEDQPDLAAGDEISVEDVKSANIDDLKLEMNLKEKIFITFNERVQQLQFYWNQCGFCINSDDIFNLACAMDRLQNHPSIAQCRFWGVINGLKASYYIVEASLTRAEIACRLEQMGQEIRDKLPTFTEKEEQIVALLPSHIGPELTPGAVGWENHPVEDLEKMKPTAAPVPVVETVEVFDVPPEVVGLGLNRYSYFVVNSFSDDWIELPIVTPKQILVSRQIKKFFTGDLEAEIYSYPCFPGKEKHYLRAIIARITAGTYIAPDGFYRKMTKREQRLYDGFIDDEMLDEEEEEDLMMDGEDETIDNDIVLLFNEKYTPEPLHTLASTAGWVHVRPNILKQGRIVWFDEEKARRDREKEKARLLKLALAEEMGEEEQEEEEEEAEAEGEEEDMLEYLSEPEIGPSILSPCSNDSTDEYTVPWIVRYTSRFTNKNERILVMRSNVWPGAYTFTFENMCESIYMGWGHKYTCRNMRIIHLPQILDEFPHSELDFIETTDPTVAEEEAYRLWLLRKHQFKDLGEHVEELEGNDDDSDVDDYDDDDNDE